MKFWLFGFFLPLWGWSQTLFWHPDTIPNCKKTWIVCGASVGIVASLYTYTGISWYSNVPRTNFHFFDDSREWKQMDKVGHSWTAFQQSKMANELFTWAGHKIKTRVWITALSGFCFQLPLEIFDGFTQKWGASWTDILANASGSLLATANLIAFRKQVIQLRFSFHPTTYSKQYPELFGKGITSTFKDYNGQTYWLSVDLHHLFFQQTKYPAWLGISFGYGAHGLEGGYHQTDWAIIQQREFRQWYLSPEIFFSKINTKKLGFKILFFALDSVHFPLFAIEWNKHYMKFHWIYF
jgi:hypothetical protein